MNNIITEKKQIYNKLTTLLTVAGKGDLWELWEYNLPYPNEYSRDGENWVISWYVDGVFWTKAGTDFINDILSRFLVSFENITYQTAHPISKKNDTLKLKLFKQLNSLKKAGFTANANKYEDSVFWSLKLFVEHYLCESDFVPYSTLENFAFNHFVDYVKDKSTLKAKCRSIWNWYSDRDWQKTKKIFNQTKEEYRMTRVENMQKIAATKVKTNYKKVVNIITGLYAAEYKKKNQKWNIMKIAKDTNLTRPTVSKHIKKYENKEQ